MSRPNIVWICTDQQRSDSLGCTGNPIANTPNIDRLAASGVRFTRHITPMQICSPSRATMFTGLYPRHHRLAINGMALDHNVPTLTQQLADHGYRTHSVGKQHLQPLLAPAANNMPDSRAFWQSAQADYWNGPYYGFQTTDLLLGEADTAAIAGHYARWLKKNHPGSEDLLAVSNAPEPPPRDLDEIWRCALPVPLHYNTWITDNAIDFVEKATERDDPFFLYVSFPDPHHPFAPPGDYADRYLADDMPLPREDAGERERMPDYYGELYPTGGGFRELYWAGRTDLEAGSMITTDTISAESMRRAIAYTYATIEMIDDGIGRLLTSLKSRRLADNTIVLFTSDHGELLGAHGLLHKGPPPYRQLTEVALIMKGPGIVQGRQVDALTSHIDLTSTFLDLADITSNALSLDGMSLAPLLHGSVTSIRDYLFGEYHPSARADVYNQTIYTDRWRMTIYPHNAAWGELFDRGADPHEHQNLFHAQGLDAVKAELAELLANEFCPQPTVDNDVLCKW